MVSGRNEGLSLVRTGDRDSRQPTIAIITSQYHEKMAVDAMMTNRQTFVRYATVGQWSIAGLCFLFCDVFIFILLRQVLFSVLCVQHLGLRAIIT